MTQKVASFEWGPEQEKALQQVQAAVQASLTLRPCHPADPMVDEVLVAGRDAVWGLWQAPINELWLRPLGFWNRACHPLQITTLTFRNSSLPVAGP